MSDTGIGTGAVLLITVIIRDWIYPALLDGPLPVLRGLPTVSGAARRRREVDPER